MGISRMNASGYMDMTAHLAVNNIEKEETILHIQHPTGYVDIRMDFFFPCQMKKARKVFRLVQMYSSEADKMRLMKFLQRLERRYQSQMRTFAKQVKEVETVRRRKYLQARFNEAERFCKRTQCNLELQQEIGGVKDAG